MFRILIQPAGEFLWAASFANFAHKWHLDDRDSGHKSLPMSEQVQICSIDSCHCTHGNDRLDDSEYDQNHIVPPNIRFAFLLYSYYICIDTYFGVKVVACP